MPKRMTTATLFRMLMALFRNIVSSRPSMKAFHAAICALVIAWSSAPAIAQSDPAYPTKPLRLIVPFAPGGTTDTSARLVSRELTKALGQQIIVENRPGAGSLVGTEAVLKLPADGYTLALATISTLAVLPLANPKVTYDPLRDFVPVTLIATLPYLIAVHPSLPATSLPQLVKLAKAKPRSISFGSPGHATGAHLTSEYLCSTTGIKLVHVPYKGDAPGVIDLVAGHIPMAVFPPLGMVPHVKTGRLRAIAVTSLERTTALPETKTVAESGYPGFESSSWNGIAVRDRNARADRAAALQGDRGHTRAQPGRARADRSERRPGRGGHAGRVRCIRPAGNREVEAGHRDVRRQDGVKGSMSTTAAKGLQVMATATQDDYQRDPTRWGSAEVAATLPRLRAHGRAHERRRDPPASRRLGPAAPPRPRQSAEPHVLVQGRGETGEALPRDPSRPPRLRRQLAARARPRARQLQLPHDGAGPAGDHGSARLSRSSTSRDTTAARARRTACAWTIPSASSRCA